MGNYPTATETQPLNGVHSRTKRNARRARTKKVLPIVGLIFIVLAMIAGVVIVVVSSGFTFRKPLSVTQPELFYSDVASSALDENLNTKTTKNTEPGCEATIMITRHCEKYFALDDKDGDSHCGYLGYERAHYLASLFGDGPDSRWPSPSRLYAMSSSRAGTDQKNFRQVETIQQLSDKVNLPINTAYTIGDETKLAKAVFNAVRKGKMCGKLIVIAWRQPQIPTLAQKLGCGPFNGCPLEYRGMVYDNIWQLKFLYNAPPSEKKVGNNDSASVLEIEDVTVPVLKGTKSYFRHRNKKKESWEVHGSVVPMRFDPLEYSRAVGDYPKGGKAVGSQWNGKKEGEKKQEVRK